MNEDLFDIAEGEWVLPELRLFWADDRTKTALAEILKRQGLTADDARQVALAYKDVVRGKTAIDDIADALSEKTGLDFDTIMEVQGDVYAELLSSQESLLAEQLGIYRDLHPDQFAPPAPPEKDAEELVAEQAVEKSGFKPANDLLHNRLIKLAEAYLKEVRTDEETRAMFEKPEKTGGLAMPADQAAAFLLILSEMRPELAAKSKEISEARQVYAAHELQAADTKARREQQFLARAAAFVPPPQAEEALLAESVIEEKESPPPASDSSLAAEITAIKLEVPTQPDVATSETDDQALERLAREAVAASGLKPADELVNQRFRAIVSLYFRDLRDALETKSKLTMPKASGGFGLDEVEASRVLAAIQPKHDEYHRLMSERMAAEKRKFVAERTEQVTTATEKNEAREQVGLDRMYTTLLERAGIKSEPVAGAQPLVQSEAQPPKFIPVVAAEKTPSPEATAEPAPKSEVTAKPEALAGPVAAPFETAAAEPPPTAKTAPPPAALPTAPGVHFDIPKPPAAPPPAEITVPPASVAPETKPVAADVKYASKLTGPVEELRSLTVKDFRRLSREPQEATLKIRDKLDLLEEQGFEVKTAGIKAWQDSEVNRLYLELLRQSLEGKPMLDVIAERENKNQPVLSKREFDAVLELNRKLRFG